MTNLPLGKKARNKQAYVAIATKRSRRVKDFKLSYWTQSTALSVFAAGALIVSLPQPAHAEGTGQIGITQPLNDIAVTDTDKFIRVDILNAGEVINLSAGGGARNAPNANNQIEFTIFDSNGVQIDQHTTNMFDQTGKISPTDPMTAPIANAYKFTTPSAGTYYVAIDDVAGNLLHRFDVTVTANAGINPDPTGATGIIGRVSSKRWVFDAGSFDESASADSDYFILTPGGFPNTNYVWKLDLNNFAGFVYELEANNQGVDAPNSGFSTPRAGNNVTEDFSLYINRPVIADPEPSQPPAVSGFTFTDSDGNDNSISPGGTIGVQDGGNFTFTTNASSGTYAIYIDVNQDGIFGNAGDVQINGDPVDGFNSVPYDGRDNNGDPLPNGNYNAELQVRLGEFHFVAADAETSGGTENGLTVFRNTPSGDVSTLVYWDDVTILGVGAGGTSTVPNGQPSGTSGGFHTWGNFTSGGFGNERFIDTYVFGDSTKAANDFKVVPDENFSDAMVDITDTSVPGDNLILTVTDADQNANSGSLDNVIVTVVNDVTGESEQVTLTETGNDTGVFTFAFPSQFGAAADTNNNGVINTQNTDTVTVSYDDPTDTFGDPQTLTDTGSVTGGADGSVSITPTSSPGDTLAIQVSDEDLTGAGTINVVVLNDVTGESETITLTESVSTPGTFGGSVPTTFGATAGTNNDGTLNSQNGDTITVTYVDDLTTGGNTANLTAQNVVSGGSTGTVTITPNSVPGDTLDITVSDSDLTGTGTLVVNATNPASGETEQITLTENVGTSGLFEGTVDTVFGAAAGTNNDGTFNTESGETIVVTYADASTAAGGTASPTATDNVGGGNDGTITIDPTSQPGDTVSVTVTDADLAGTGSLEVIIVNDVTGESETITLIENAGTPGLFEGTINTVFGTAAGTNDDGVFNTQNNDTLTITYNDALTSTGGPAASTRTNNVSGGSDGTVTITPNSVPGDTLNVSVTDADLTGFGSIVVNGTNPTTGETEQITLSETSAGVFEGTVETAFGTAAGTNDDGTFNTERGETIVVTYADASTSTGGSASPTATDNVGGGNDGVVTIDPTSQPGDTIAITVTDADLAGTGTLIVPVVNTDTGESEQIALTENAGMPGLFEGTVDTTFGTVAGANDDGTFNTQSGNALVVTYNDALTNRGGTSSRSATDNVTGGNDGTVTITPNSVPGDTLAITVTDTDLAGSSTLEVNATNPSTGEAEQITLTESAGMPGLFEGTVNTVFGENAGANNDGTFNTENGETIVVTYQDALTSIGGTSAPTATNSVGGGTDGTVSITPNAVPGDTIAISVGDADLAGNGSIIVTTVNPDTGESEQVTLTETSPGVFDGTVSTAFGTAAGSNDDGVFSVQNGNTLVAEYDDILTSTGSTATPMATANVGGGADGTISITPNSVPGDTLAITVSDTDLAGTSTLEVNATNPSTGETEQITLTESAGMPGLFEGTVNTVFGENAGANNDGTFNTENGETIVVTYEDALTSIGGSSALTATNNVEGGVDGTISTTPNFTPGDPIAVTVNDADLTGASTLTVIMVNNGTGESEQVTLTETSPAVFEGTVDTAFGTTAGADGDGTFNAQNGDTLTVTYNDALTSSGGTASPTDTSSTIGGDDGKIIITQNSVPGDTLTVSLTDADLAGTGSVMLHATNLSTAEAEQITLTETSPGVFEGTVDTVFGATAGTDNDGTFNVENGHTIEVSYTDDLGSTGGSATLTASTAIGGGVEGTVNLTPASVPGDVLTASVEDADLNTDAAAVETITVEIVNQNSGEIETLTLTETGPNTGLFEGNVDTILGANAGVNNNGTFNTTPGDVLVLTYDDILTSTGGSNSVTAQDDVMGMTVLKVGTLNDGGDGEANIGDVIDYVFTIENTSNVDLSNVAIRDALVAVEGGPIANFPAGQTDSTTFTASYTITDTDLDAGSVTNTAIANATGPGGASVAATSDDPNNPAENDPDGDGYPSDPTVTSLGAAPSLALIKVGTLNDGGDGIVNVGDTVDYTFTVVNRGNVTINDITITDALVNVDGGPISSLKAGATDPSTFTASYVLTQADIDAGGVTNTATATGQDPQNNSVTGVSDDPNNPADVDPDGDGNPSDPTEIKLTPVTSLAILKTATLDDGGDGFADIGDTISYAFTVTNTGNVNLTNIAVLDDLVAVDGRALATLDVGVSDSTTFTAIYTLTQDDLDSGSVTNSAMVTADAPNGDPVIGVSDDPTNPTDLDSDGDGNPSDPTVTSLATNKAPVAENDSTSTQLDTPVSIPALANDSDPEGSTLTISEVTQGTNGTVIFQPDGTVVYTPNPEAAGTDSFTYTVCDEGSRCATATVNVTVDNNTPFATADSVGTEPNTPVVIPVLANDIDPDDDLLMVKEVVQPASGTVVINPDGTLTYTPNADFVGLDSFIYTACDADENCDTATVSANVSPDAPQAQDDLTTTASGEPVITPVLTNDSDPNDDPLTVTAVSQPANGSVVINPDGTVTYTPAAGFVGSDVFTYTICDADNNCDTATASVSVTNQAPTAGSDTASTLEGTPVIIAILDNDADPEGALTVTAVTQPTGGTVVINTDSTLAFTPDDGFTGLVTFTYTICDEAGECATANVDVSVEPATPVLANDTGGTQSGEAITIAVLDNDTDPNGDPLTVTGVVQPMGGTVVINPDGTLTVTPDDGFVGVLPFSYTACDDDNNCSTANVTVTFEPPVASLNGVVFIDLNGDDIRQLNEPLEDGWIVEVHNVDGRLVTTVLTDEDGFYEVNDLPVGEYKIIFRNPDNDTVYGIIESVSLTGGVTAIDQNQPIDPSGVVYDAITRLPVPDVTVTLVDANADPLPPACFVDSSQQNQRTDRDGMYRFDIVPGAAARCPVGETNYRIDYDAPDAYRGAASTIIAAESTALNPPAGIGPFAVSPLATAPASGADTTHYLTFVLGEGDRDVINNHIPLDPLSLVRSPLVITKTTPRRDVSFGDLVSYTITVTNSEDLPYVNLDIVDLTPPGFRYVADSARINGVGFDPEQHGRELIFTDRGLGANETVTIDIVLVVGASVNEGNYVNQAFVRNTIDGSSLSGVAEATVQIIPSPLFDCSEVIGKVFDDQNQDGYQNKGEQGISGARVVTANGLITTTDKSGRYHIACAAVPNANIGSNFILKLDERSLPTGYRLTTENPRVARLTRGKMTEMNFGASIHRVVTLDLASEAFITGDTRMSVAMAQNIASLIEILKSEESVLRVNYHDHEGLGELADARLQTVEAHIHEMWDAEGCCYNLKIEQKMIRAGIRPTSYRAGGE